MLATTLFGLTLSACSGSNTPYSYGNKEKPVLTASFSPAYSSSTNVTLNLSSTTTSQVTVIESSQADCEAETKEYTFFRSSVPVTLTQLNANTTVWVKVRSSGRVWSDCVQASVVHDNTVPSLVSGIVFDNRIPDLATSPTLRWSGGSDVGPAGIDYYYGEITKYDPDEREFEVIHSGITIANNSTGNISVSSEAILATREYSFKVAGVDKAGNQALAIESSSSFSIGGTLNLYSTLINDYFPSAIGLGDINGDGFTDFLHSDHKNSQLNIQYNSGNAAPSTLSQVSNSYMGITNIQVADINADGNLDIIVASLYHDKVIWFESDGAATPAFTARELPFNLIGASLISIADMDGDGDLDIVASGIYEDNLIWYENDGAATPTFTQNIIFTSAYATTEIIPVDLDADGDLDIVTASEGDDTLAWFENDGAANPTFVRNVIASNLNHIRGAAVGDFNGDGFLDITTANWLDNEIGLHLSDGAADPSFTTSTIDNPGPVTGVKASDMDGDGVADIVVQISSRKIRIYLSNGAATPTFTSQFVTDRAEEAWYALLFDIDSDGDKDIVTTSSSALVIIER